MPRGEPRADELGGFLDGLRHRLRRREEAGRPNGEAARALADGERALRGRDLAAAERSLLRADRILDEGESEMELIEYPRGLVGYVPTGGKGSPPELDEEPLWNRLLLIQRLVELRRQQGIPVEREVRLLSEAEEAYRRGDRAGARTLVDEAHRSLESSAPGPAARPR